MPTKSLKIFHSTALTMLLDQLGKDLSTPLADPFTPELVVVPNSDMARYLKRELSRTLGASGFDDGIVSNISFIYPRQLINANSQSPLDSFSSRWDAEQLTWMIVDTLMAHKETVQAPGFESSPLSTARRVASLYDRYASHRPEMLNHWARSGVDDGTSTNDRPNDVKRDQLWQQKLFAELSKTLKTREPDLARAIDNLDDFKRALNSKSAAELPARISVFGISSLSRGARQVLEAISDVSDVTLYFVYFARKKWPKQTASPTELRESFDIGGPKHYLSKRWGAQIVESAAVLGNSQPTDLGSYPPKNTLLGLIQSDITNDQLPPLTDLSGEDLATIKHSGDGTIQIHACYGLARQAEALRDSILHLMNEDPTLRLRDIAILCGDVEASAPILSAVLAPNKTGAKNLPELAINVVNDSSNTQDPLIEALFALLHLFTSRCSPSDVLDVAQLEPIRRNFDFDDDAIRLIGTWSEQLVIRYGLNADHRQTLGMKDALPIGTWAQALDRLFVGVAVPGEVDRLGPGGIVPYDGVSGSDLSTAGAVAEFITQVKKFADSFVPMSIAEWCKTLLKIVDKFISGPRNDSEQLIRIASSIDRMGQNANGVTDMTVSAKFSVSELTQMFKESLGDGFGMFSSKFETITVSGFKNLAHIPFRALCVFGADEQVFAGSQIDGDDVLSINPCIGEPIYSLDGRQTLLNAVMSASDNLIITCNGSDISNNKALPLAVPVQELLELANQYIYRANADKKRLGSQAILARHPRQNFDQKVLTSELVYSNKPFTFDKQSKFAFKVLNGTSDTDLEKKSDQTLEEDSKTNTKSEKVDLKSLVDVVTNPTEYFVKSILKARIPKMPSDEDKRDSTIQGDGILNLTIDGLAQSGEGRQLLDQIAKSDSDFTSVATSWASLRPISGQLPPGKLGDLIIAEIKTELSQMIDKLPSNLQSLGGGKDIDCEIPFNGASTIFRIENVHEDSFARVLYKRVNESLKLELWIELAILTLHTRGNRFEAHLVTRGPKKGSDPERKHFALKGDTEQERLENAQKVLDCATGMYRAALAGPVPFFENASGDIRQGNQKHALELLETKDLQYSAELKYIFGDKEPEDILNAPAQAEDYARTNQKKSDDESVEISRAKLFADFIYNAFDETVMDLNEEKTNSGGGSNHINDEDGKDE